MSSRRSVWVIGASGFVGRTLVPALRAAGWEVRAASRTGEGGARVDVADAASVRAFFAGAPAPEAVVHLAAIAHQPRGGVEPGAYDAVNHRGAAQVIDAAREAGVPRFVLYSSASVYGDAGRRDPVRESDALSPVGAYARSKAAAEEALFRAPGAMHATALRFPAIYAADWLLDVRKRAYVPGMTRKALLSVPGRQPRYSLCAVANAAAATLLALGGALPPGPCNVADAAPYDQAEVARVVGALDGVSRRIALPRWAVRAAFAPAALAPRGLHDAVRGNYWKLFEGLVLDTGRIAAAGYRPAARLDDLLRARG